MATKGTPSHTTQRCTSPPGLLAFVPLKEQNDFSKYLYSQFLLWNKERRRCFYTARRYYKHLKLNIFEKTSLFSSSYSSTSTLLQPCFPRSESVKTIRTSIARTFSVSHECTSTVLRVSPLKNKRTPWMESEKILRRSTRPSPPKRSSRHPSSRVQILSRTVSPSKQDNSSSHRSALLSRNSPPPSSRPPLSGQPRPAPFTKDSRTLSLPTSSTRPSSKIFIDPSSHCYPGPVEELPLHTQLFLATLQDYDLPFPKVKDFHHSKSPGRKKGKKRK